GCHVSDVVPIVTIFLVFFLQKYGPAFFAPGIVAFITMYISSLLQVQFFQLPWLYVAAIVGTTFALISNFIVFRHQPSRNLIRSMRTFLVQIGLTMGLMSGIIGRTLHVQGGLKRLDKNTTKLSEYMMLISGQITSFNLN